jgi:hypothetical protein
LRVIGLVGVVLQISGKTVQTHPFPVKLCGWEVPSVVQEVIAKRIIKAAMKGERDPARLRAAGLAALGYDREAI